MTVKFGAHGGNITVKAHNTCGIGPARTLAVTMNCREMENGSAIVEDVLYPNPSSSHFIFRPDTKSQNPVTLLVSDITGKQIEWIQNILPGSEIMFGEKYMPGIYFVTITGDEAVKILKVVKQE